jgi:hypothetical protein
MKRCFAPVLLSTALLTSCGQGAEQNAPEDLRTFDVVEEAGQPPAPGAAPAPPQQATPGGSQTQSVAVSLPQIAYTYSYAFRLSSDRVSEVQERHLDLCERLGPSRCRVLNLERGSSSGDYVMASLRLQVAAPLARQFGRQIVAAASEAGADTVERGIAAEDLSKQMVDTEARIRTREALVQRLTQLLQTRSGNIQQAVEAERAINSAQEELEAARAWLEEMRSRVAMSTFQIDYASGAPLAGGAQEPLRVAIAETGTIFARSLAFIITALALLLPWLILALLIFLLVRTARQRGWIGKRDPMDSYAVPPPDHSRQD